jgi:hypothetical protein
MSLLKDPLPRQLVKISLLIVIPNEALKSIKHECDLIMNVNNCSSSRVAIMKVCEGKKCESPYEY